MTDTWLKIRRKIKFSYTKSWSYGPFDEKNHRWFKRFEPLTFIKVFYQEIRGPKWFNFVWDENKKIYRKIEFDPNRSGRYHRGQYIRGKVGDRHHLNLITLKYERKEIRTKRDYYIFYARLITTLKQYTRIRKENEKLQFELKCAIEARDYWLKRYGELWNICIKEKCGPGKYISDIVEGKKIINSSQSNFEPKSTKKIETIQSNFEPKSTKKIETIQSNFEPKLTKKIETIEDLMKISGTFAAEMNLKNKTK